MRTISFEPFDWLPEAQVLGGEVRHFPNDTIPQRSAVDRAQSWSHQRIGELSFCIGMSGLAAGADVSGRKI